MSSEKFELAQDELEALLERLQGEVASLASAQGEARKRAIQVFIDFIIVMNVLCRPLFSFRLAQVF